MMQSDQVRTTRISVLNLLILYVMTVSSFGQEPSKAIQLFAKANAGWVDIVAPTVAEVDHHAIVFFAEAKKTMDGFEYEPFSQIPFVLIILRDKASGLECDGKVEAYQLAVMKFCGELRIGNERIEFKHWIGQLESDNKIVLDESMTISLLRGKELFNENFSFDAGRLLVADLRENKKLTVHQNKLELPTRRLLDGVTDAETRQEMEDWVKNILRTVHGTVEPTAEKTSGQSDAP